MILSAAVLLLVPNLITQFLKTISKTTLDGNSRLGPHRMVWKHIWNAKVASKIKICAWKLWNEILAAGMETSSRIPRTSSNWCQSNYELEDVMHALKDCPLAAKSSVLGVFPNEISKGVFANATDQLEIAAKLLYKDNFDKFLVTLWNLRNATKHKGLETMK